MLRYTFILLALLPGGALRAQTDTVYVLRPDRYVGAFVKIRINVGDQSVVLPNNSYSRVICTGDSVILRIVNTRLSGPSAAPIVTHKRVSYFVTVPEEHAYKLDRLILTEVDKDVYGKYASRVTREVNPRP